MRIVFMGTPEFAVPSLRALLDAGFEVVGAFTQPDRPAGRGNRMNVCPVKQLAVERGVPVFQFERIRRKEGVAALQALKPDLCVTAAFGQILSQKILDIPPMGTVNVHASLLPKYRGAAPINWCIAMGERVAGVTIMFTDVGIDTGDVVMWRETTIGERETAGELTARLAELGAQLLLEAVDSIQMGSCPRIPQDPEKSSHQPMLSREMAKIDWNRSCYEIACMVRGFNPWPGAHADLDGMPLKIWMAQPFDGDLNGQPGEVLVSDPKKGLVVACGEGALDILTLQAPNARQMDAKPFLMGHPIPTGTVIK